MSWPATSDARFRPLNEADAEGEGEWSEPATSPTAVDEAALARLRVDGPREDDAVAMTLDDAAAAEAVGAKVASLADVDMTRSEGDMQMRGGRGDRKPAAKGNNKIRKGTAMRDEQKR